MKAKYSLLSDVQKTANISICIWRIPSDYSPLALHALQLILRNDHGSQILRAFSAAVLVPSRIRKKYQKKLRYYARMQLLFIDDFAISRYSEEGMNILYQLVKMRG